jgi:hypothetical protein
MFKLDPKERWGYSDLKKKIELSQHFEKYTELDLKDAIAAKINFLIEEGKII